MDALVSSLATMAAETAVPKLMDFLKKRKDIGDFADIGKLLKLGRQPLDRTDSLKRIGEAYRNEKLVLVLGAGVSKDYGIPAWKDLLQKLLGKTFESEDTAPEKASYMSEMFDKVFGPDPTIAARRLSIFFNKVEGENGSLSFERAVRDALYEGLPSQHVSALFDEIVQFCVAPGRSYNLDCVISYNFDDILETHLRELPVKVLFSPVFSAGQNPDAHELAIYHVHGFLPRSGKLTRDNSVTLGDDAYHSQYAEIYRWSNLVQINKYKDCNCLFIGTSFTDPNQRRLLDVAKQQRGTDSIQHFLIKRKYQPREIEKALVSILQTGGQIVNEEKKEELGLSDTVQDLVDAVHKFETSDAHSFNTEVIWVDEFAEIPDLLREIRSISSS